jgi:hypothetical protein
MGDVRRDKEGKAVGVVKNPRPRKVKKPTHLCTLTEEERVEYINRFSLMENKHREFLAMGAFVDILREEFRLKYDLPIKYILDLDTGNITEVEVEA